MRKTVDICTFYAEGFSCTVTQDPLSLKAEFVADLDIDADGGPHAYHQEKGKGLDYLPNAGHPGNWWGLATDRNGKPFVQQAGDPAPGFFVSTTAYQWTEFPKDNPRRYVNSETVPFVVVFDFVRRMLKGIVLGCRAILTNLDNGLMVEGVVADIGPLNKLGEASIAAAQAIGIDGNPKKGGSDLPRFRYELFPGTPARVNGVEYRLIPRK